jgi:hypothetical protein
VILATEPLPEIVEREVKNVLFCKTKETEVPGMPQVFVTLGSVGIVELAIDCRQCYWSWAVGLVKRALSSGSQSWWAIYPKCEC